MLKFARARVPAPGTQLPYVHTPRSRTQGLTTARLQHIRSSEYLVSYGCQVLATSRTNVRDRRAARGKPSVAHARLHQDHECCYCSSLERQTIDAVGDRPGEWCCQLCSLRWNRPPWTLDHLRIISYASRRLAVLVPCASSLGAGDTMGVPSDVCAWGCHWRLWTAFSRAVSHRLPASGKFAMEGKEIKNFNKEHSRVREQSERTHQLFQPATTFYGSDSVLVASSCPAR